MKLSLIIAICLFVIGCSTVRETQIEPRIATTTPTPTDTHYKLRDSLVVRWVVRDSVNVKDSTVIHVADATNFYIFSGWFVNEHGDSNYVSVDTQTGEGECITHFAPVKVPYQDTTHQVLPAPIQTGAGTWTIAFIAIVCFALGGLAGKFAI